MCGNCSKHSRSDLIGRGFDADPNARAPFRLRSLVFLPGGRPSKRAHADVAHPRPNGTRFVCAKCGRTGAVFGSMTPKAASAVQAQDGQIRNHAVLAADAMDGGPATRGRVGHHDSCPRRGAGSAARSCLTGGPCRAGARKSATRGRVVLATNASASTQPPHDGLRLIQALGPLRPGVEQVRRLRGAIVWDFFGAASFLLRGPFRNLEAAPLGNPPTKPRSATPIKRSAARPEGHCGIAIDRPPRKPAIQTQRRFKSSRDHVSFF